MAQTKFHEKNVECFLKIQTTEGVYVEPATTDVIPAISMDGSVTDETGSYEFIGDALSRDENTFLKDSMADFTLETPFQVLGTLNPALAVANVPLSAAMRCCGGSISVNGSTGVVTIGNNVAENSLASIAYRKSSNEDAVNQKLLKFYDIRGSLDVTLNVGDIPKIKLAFKGNATAPEQNPKVISDYQTQKVRPVASILPETIQQAQITPYGENFNTRSTISGTPSITFSGNVATVTLTSHGLTDGRLVVVSGATGTDGAFYNGIFTITYLTVNTFSYTMQGTPGSNAAGTLVVKKDGFAKSFCFNSLTANNFFGFDYARFMTGCEVGYSKKAVPTDVAITSMEGIANIYTASGITRSTSTATATVLSHGFVAGDVVTVAGATGADATYYNGTFTVAAPVTTDNFNYQMSGTPGASAATTDGLKITLVTQAIFNPDVERQKYFSASIKIGSATGKYITFSWDKLQLASVKDGKVAEFMGKDVNFRNTGKSYIIQS
jgi:hypothetical protein